MSSQRNNFVFSPNFNFSTTTLINRGVFSSDLKEKGAPFPPVAGNMDLLNDSPMLLLDGTDMLLL